MNMKKNNFISRHHPFFISLFVTLLSLVIIDRCDGFICVSGRGFPLPYWGDNFYLPFLLFLADLVIWWIGYTVDFIIFKIIQNPRIFTK